MSWSGAWRSIWLRKSLRRVGTRFVSHAAPPHDPSKIRNLAVVAHIDSGKTTLTESILLKSNYLSTPGTVDTGSTTTDFLPAERERGITIQSASIPVRWRDWNINLIDTPGHADFGMEVESASRVVDGAVVLIDAVEGVESQTQGVWRQLDRYEVPSRLLFLNKMDRIGASFRSSMLSLLSYRLHPKPLALTLPVASFDPKDYASAEPGIAGIIDLVKWELWRWNSDGNFSPAPLPPTVEEIEASGALVSHHPMLSHLLPARTAMLESLSMFSDELMETLLSLPSETSSYLSVRADTILPALRNATLRNEVLPVLCGSAMKHVGTDLVLDYAGELLASPLDVAITSLDKSELQMLAWKVSWDSRKGWMTFVRVYSGTLTKQTTLMNVSRNEREKVSKLLLLYASEPEEVDSLSFGSVGVILGLKHTRTGDTLVGAGGPQSKLVRKSGPLRDITAPPAVMSASIMPQSTADLKPVQDALLALSRTDPSARIELADGQLLVHGLGALHLEIIEGRLRDEWGVKFESGRRRVSYREGFGGAETDLSTDWHSEVQGRTITVNMHLIVRQLEDDELGDPAWDGNRVVDKDGRAIAPPDAGGDPKSPMTHVSQGLWTALSNSPHTSLPLSRTFVKVQDFTIVDKANVSVLAGASCVILRKIIIDADMGPVMEPYIRLKVDVGEEDFGKVMKDLIEKGGEVLDLCSTASAMAVAGADMLPFSPDGIYIPPAWLSPSSLPPTLEGSSPLGSGLKRIINALAPLSKMLDFSNRLRAMSGGRGTFELSNAGFRAVDQTRKAEILKEIGRA